MRLMLDTTAVTFTVTKAPEPRRDFGKTEQKVDRDTGRPQWVVEVLAMDPERGEVIRVTVAGSELPMVLTHTVSSRKTASAVSSPPGIPHSSWRKRRRLSGGE